MLSTIFIILSTEYSARVFSTEYPGEALHSLLPGDRMFYLQVPPSVNKVHLEQLVRAPLPPPDKPDKEPPEKMAPGDQDDGVEDGVDEGGHAGHHVEGQVDLVSLPLTVRHDEHVCETDGVTDEEGRG